MGSKRIRVPIKPELLRWARERAGYTLSSLARQFPRYAEWEQGKTFPTLKQVERLAHKFRVPMGLLSLDSPPKAMLPIPDFRTMPEAPEHPNPDLLDTIFHCQERQAWYREYLQRLGAKPLLFVRKVTLDDDPVTIATDIRQLLMFEVEQRRKMRSWTEAWRYFAKQAESAGILVMSSGVVGNNPHRKLDPQEFRGFVLVDDLAPVIFINAADTKAAQIFTLAHELAHIWLGESGISDVQMRMPTDHPVERWCNQVAAELLVPIQTFRQVYQPHAPLRGELDRLARYFKVSTLVILRRIHEIGALTREEFWQAYDEELAYLRRFERRVEGGGNFYSTLRIRVSEAFARAVVVSTLEGQTLFRDAYRMLGIRKPETFRKFAKSLGIG